MLSENNIQKNVLEKIKGGDVTMHSRAYFFLHTTLLAVLALAVLALALFALSFVFFSVHESGIQYLLEFNERGLVTFVSLFPWLSLAFFISLLLALEFVVRRFDFAYRFPLLRIFLWILITSITGSTLLGFTPLHSSLLSAADDNQLPIIGSWYEHIHDTHQTQGVYRGKIMTLSETSFVISHDDTDRDSDDGSWTIIPPAGFDMHQLSVGEKVYVAGRLQDEKVYTYGIHSIQEDE